MAKPKKTQKDKGLYGEEIETTVPLSEYEDHDFDNDETIIREDSDSAFKELRNLITSKDIDVKTVLSVNQITRLQKLSMLHKLLQSGRDNLPLDTPDFEVRQKNIDKVATLVYHFQNTFMKLVINKEGLSRKQFIEALHKGEEKVQQSQQQKLQQILNI